MINWRVFGGQSWLEPYLGRVVPSMLQVSPVFHSSWNFLVFVYVDALPRSWVCLSFALPTLVGGYLFPKRVFANRFFCLTFSRLMCF